MTEADLAMMAITVAIVVFTMVLTLIIGRKL